MSIVNLVAPGITCGGCVRKVTNALQGQAGVTSADVRIGGAAVEFDPAVTSVDAIKEKVEAAGYQVISVQ